jgi:hypothetical protein
MNHEGMIRDLKNLIDDWEYEKNTLSSMINLWEEYDDPGSDPGLQYEQEMLVEDKWNSITDFCKENFK